MLVFSRMVGERVVIKCGDIEVYLTVVEVSGHKVRLGFEAPSEVLIHRQEVFDRMGGQDEQTGGG